MQTRRLKFVLCIAIVLGAVLWLGMSSYEESKSYYVTADEFLNLEPAKQARRTRLTGDVVAGSIQRTGGTLSFALTMNGATVPVVYRGSDPVPDTFKDGAQALVEGRIGSDGRFEGQQIQAKCASKYEADPAVALKYGTTRPGQGGASQPAPEATGR